VDMASATPGPMQRTSLPEAGLNRRLAPVVAVIVSVAGCSGNSTPTSPTTTSSVVSPAGSWSGSIRDPVSGDGTAQLSLGAQAPNSLTGTWSATFRNGDSYSGPAMASLVMPTGYGVILYVDPPPPCVTVSGPGGSALLSFTLIDLAVTSSQLTAVLGRLSCSGISFGTVKLSKQ
jgi:hypothetical protein